MTVPTIVFDLDGTLVDTAPDLVAAQAVALGLEGLPPVPFEHARPMIGAGAAALVRRGLELHGHAVSEARFGELVAAFLHHYERHIADASRPYPGAVEALEALAGENARLAICTNKPERYAVDLLEILGLSTRFAAICGGDTFAARKPDPMHLLGTIERAGGEPARAVMIGDSRNDVAPARAAGVPVVLVDFGYTDIPAAELGADRVISHFSELGEALLALTRPRRASIHETG